MTWRHFLPIRILLPENVCFVRNMPYFPRPRRCRSPAHLLPSALPSPYDLKKNFCISPAHGLSVKSRQPWRIQSRHLCRRHPKGSSQHRADRGLTKLPFSCHMTRGMAFRLIFCMRKGRFVHERSGPAISTAGSDHAARLQPGMRNRVEPCYRRQEPFMGRICAENRTSPLF